MMSACRLELTSGARGLAPCPIHHQLHAERVCPTGWMRHIRKQAAAIRWRRGSVSQARREAPAAAGWTSAGGRSGGSFSRSASGWPSGTLAHEPHDRRHLGLVRALGPRRAARGPGG